MGQRRSRLKAVLAVLMGGVVSVAVFEAALRTIEATPLWRALPLIEPILGGPDADTGYAFIPGADGIWQRENRAPVHINALGLRNPEMARDKPAGGVRVGLTGDSMVEALQVEQPATFAALAEAQLNRDGGTVQVLNLAMSGNGPLRQLVRLEKLGPGLGLDLAVSILTLTDFLTGELLNDSQNPGYVADGHGGLMRGGAFRQRFAIRTADTWYGKGLMAVIRHSAVARMLYLRSRDPLPMLLGVTSGAASSPTKPAAGPSCDARAFDRALGLWRDRQPAPAWQAAQKLLDEYAAFQTRQGTPVVLAMDHIPLAQPGCAGEGEKRAELAAIVRAEVERRGLLFVDWRRLLADSAGAAGVPLSALNGFGLERGHGGHLNYLGHRVYAQVLADTLRLHLPARGQPIVDNRAGMQ